MRINALHLCKNIIIVRFEKHDYKVARRRSIKSNAQRPPSNKTNLRVKQTLLRAQDFAWLTPWKTRIDRFHLFREIFPASCSPWRLATATPARKDPLLKKKGLTLQVALRVSPTLLHIQRMVIIVHAWKRECWSGGTVASVKCGSVNVGIIGGKIEFDMVIFEVLSPVVDSAERESVKENVGWHERSWATNSSSQNRLRMCRKRSTERGLRSD